tara:strand:- start:1629 stop:4376 length:2748 start_codon:yes stop_codon:yes gene_type:complete
MNSGNFKKNPVKQAMTALAMSGMACTSGSVMAAEPTFLEEIIVTATRREAALQDVAIPMTAVTGEALERRFAQDLRDLTNAAPNVQFEPVGIFQNSASFFIRGQGTGDIESAADGKVGIYIDGVFQARVSTALSDMLDVRSVEILRGPQGTLFGRNTVAGAVQVLHNDPEMNEWDGSVALQVGDFGRLDVKGIVNIPMVDDTLAGRVAVKSTHHDGYWKNSSVGKDRAGTDRLTINPSLKWTPNDRFSAVLRGEWSETRDDTNMTQAHNYCRDDPFNVFLGLPADNDLVILTQTFYNAFVLGQDPVTAAAGAAELCGKPLENQSASDEFTAINTEDRGQFYNTDVVGITLRLDYALGEIGDLTYIGNYRDTEEDIIFTIDVAPHDLFAGRRTQDHYQTTHELRFASNFSDNFDFVAGAYYFEQEYAMKQSSWGMLFAPNIILNPPDPTAISFTHPSTYGQAQFSTQLNKAWALFTQANWHPTDKITITVGGRYTSETKRFMHCAVGSGDESQPASKAKNAEGCNDSPAFVIDPTQPPVLDPPGTTGTATPTPLWALVPAIGYDASGGAEAGCRPVLDPTGAPITCNNRLVPPRAKWTDFTPMAGITYRFNDDAMAYFTWTRGFTGGGWNGRGGTASSIGPFNPEEGQNFELGIKTDWWDRRLRVNVSAFDTKVKNFQTAFIRAAPGGGGQETIQSNLGSFETKGVELEVTVAPTEYLNVWANVSHLKTKRVGFCTDPDGFHNTGDPLNPPTVGGPFSQDAPLCGTPERVEDSIGNFLGWLVPVDVSEISRGGRAPEWTMSAGFILNFNLNDMGSLTLSGDWQWSDESGIGGSRVNEPDGVLQYNGDFLKHKRESYNILNASATWRSPNERYQISAFVKNITNELYNQATTVVGGLLNFRVTNIRRHWAVEFKMNL